MWLNEEQWNAVASHIPARQLLAFRLVFSEGLTYEQAAKTMGISEQTVSRLIKRIRNKYPDCVPNTDKPKLLRFDPKIDDGQIVGRF